MNLRDPSAFSPPLSASSGGEVVGGRGGLITAMEWLVHVLAK
jgi:hypothetical protein